jgi:hypothetical protein
VDSVASETGSGDAGATGLGGIVIDVGDTVGAGISSSWLVIVESVADIGTAGGVTVCGGEAASLRSKRARVGSAKALKECISPTIC